MKIRCLFIGWMLLWSGVSAAPEADSALWAATMLGRMHQQTAFLNLHRWEAMNLWLTGQEDQAIPEWVGPVIDKDWEQVWWTHSPALKAGVRDSIQQELGMLELLSQTIARADRESFGARRRPEDQLALSSLQELAVAVEDANIVLDRLSWQLQKAARRIHRVPQSSAESQARQFFSEGMDKTWAMMEAVKTGRRMAAEALVQESRVWLRNAPARRKRWRQAFGQSTSPLPAEKSWMLWERKFQQFLGAMDQWLGGQYPPSALHREWSRNYLWYNHELLELSSGPTESLTSALLDFFSHTGSLMIPEYGRNPAFRPVGLPEQPAAIVRKATSWIFVVDVSGSMHNADRLPLFRQSMAGWIAQQPGDHDISLISFSDTASILVREVQASRYQDVLDQSGWLNSGGESRVLPAMELAAGLARQSAGQARVVLVTDGGFRYDRELASLVEQLGYEDIPVDAVFLPGDDARYESSLRQLIGTGTGTCRILGQEKRNLGM